MGVRVLYDHFTVGAAGLSGRRLIFVYDGMNEFILAAR